MKEIKSEDKLLARFISSEEWSEGLGFYSKDSEFIQVGTWKYNKGKQLLNHKHNEINRQILRTHEVLYVKKGAILAKIYDLTEVFIDEVIVREGDILILLDCGHGYTVLDDNTEVLEIKNGPYLGAEIDRKRF